MKQLNEIIYRKRKEMYVFIIRKRTSCSCRLSPYQLRNTPARTYTCTLSWFFHVTFFLFVFYLNFQFGSGPNSVSRTRSIFIPNDPTACLLKKKKKGAAISY